MCEIYTVKAEEKPEVKMEIASTNTLLEKAANNDTEKNSKETKIKSGENEMEKNS